jgi:transposase
LSRNKTDKADAKVIAYFCEVLHPTPWQPTPKHIMHLRNLLKRIDDLEDLKRQEKNRLLLNPSTSKYIKDIIFQLEQQYKTVCAEISTFIEADKDLKTNCALLASIPGIGNLTSARIVAAISDISHFDSPKQLAAYFGLSPRNYQSGTSVAGKTRLSKIGNANIRKALYFPAIVAIQHNPILKDFAKRLTDRGKSKMAIICAVMRKLIHIVFGILKSNQPFDAKTAIKKALEISSKTVSRKINTAKKKYTRQHIFLKQNLNNKNIYSCMLTDN